MKNKLTLVIVLMTLLVVVLGCSSITDRLSEKKGTNGANKTLSDKAVDTALGESTVGVTECDEVLNMLAAEMNNPDDNFVTKAGKGYVLNKIKDGIKQSLEENKNDTAKMAKECRNFKVQLDKYKADQEKKQAE